jgi:hypothetical protein
VGRLRALVAEEPDLASTTMEHWVGHPAGVSPLGYVAMLRYDSTRGIWREVDGAGAIAAILVAAGAWTSAGRVSQSTRASTAIARSRPSSSRSPIPEFVPLLASSARQHLEVELDRLRRQDLRAADGDKGGDDCVEAVAARVAAASTRS